ncbi:MAG: hypothetical protein E5Y63_07530 [Mesorhizobium sp.]|uniref:hypothetical protein n=2 Tax=Mesorhizobium sp. TaxID=1871066 RepID=UPI000FE64BD0|nr:hypothetical protein [Mesorhizobium sp.]RWP40722.1 MAG: hypothetical protein EOR04_17840 [Mesorhizobium sp.]RWP60392.1 MAG: hypothetical protein EOR08_20455 [Mesorhizobium sp.]TIM31537.1 MAG: hypothetical protein E5Y63_07530 [Mesorhizobium sp.]
MTRLLPALHEGHAPVYLHQAFSDALDAFEGWEHRMDEPLVEFEGLSIPISSVFGRMRSCSDLLPIRILEDVAAIVPERLLASGEEQLTYADAARVLRALCVERLRNVEILR